MSATDARFTRDIVLAFSSAGAILAATGGHSPVCFWDVATGRKLSAWKKDEDTSTHGLAFSPMEPSWPPRLTCEAKSALKRLTKCPLARR